MGLNILGPFYAAAGIVQRLTGAPPIITKRAPNVPLATISTADAVTYTAQQWAAGVLLRDPNGASRTDTAPSAATLCTALGLINKGDEARILLSNLGEVTEVLTISGGTGNTYATPVALIGAAATYLTITRTSESSASAAVTLAVESAPGIRNATVTTVATAGAATYSAAAVAGGYIARDPAGGNRTDLTPTAAQLNAALPTLAIGGSFDLVLKNTADAAETITLNGNTGVTLIGTIDVAQNETGVTRFIKTAVAAYDVVQLG